MVKPAAEARDEDRNIIGPGPVELRHYKYNTGLIPSAQIEELLRLITKDWHQSLLVYHQLVQGKHSFWKRGLEVGIPLNALFQKELSSTILYFKRNS